MKSQKRLRRQLVCIVPAKRINFCPGRNGPLVTYGRKNEFGFIRYGFEVEFDFETCQMLVQERLSGEFPKARTFIFEHSDEDFGTLIYGVFKK